ncbi:porin family protein [Gilvimarinus chinensis]|uniref:porin family protein n=1 Tax=Gilvimarinus chinensis TaxID=396005 RepID=UPI00036CCC37|nr:porin family protein [Gilvimarinus chinensis]
MNYRNSIAALAIPLTLLAPLSYADNNRGFFAGAGVSAINVDDSPSFAKANMWGGEVFGGYKLNPWLGAEVRYGLGLGEESTEVAQPLPELNVVTGDSLTMEMDHYSAVYYRAEAVNQTGRFYALLGYADIEFTMKSDNHEITLSEDDFSWGLGVGFILDPHLNVNFEYRNLLDANEYRFTTITASLDYRF